MTNRILNRGKSPINTIINGPEVIFSSSDKAEPFTTNFAANSTLDDSNQSLSDSPSRTDSIVPDFHVSVKEVSCLIHELEANKATGPDQIPVVVLKNLSPELSLIIAKLFNRCIKEKCFPSSWKLSSVRPVFKNCGEHSTPSQYRPISLLSTITEVFEIILNKHVMDHLSKADLLSDTQNGFCSSRSTADVLTVITHRISRALDSNFDAVLLHWTSQRHFERFGKRDRITDRTYAIIKSFLTGSSMKVVINVQSSDVH